MKKIFVCLILFLSQSLYSQEDLSNLFIKCDRCDNNFLKNEINYVNHVREQGLADIQLFIYRNRNANNGNRYSLDFIGKNEFSEKELSLVLDTNPRLTQDEVRNALKKRIDIGLVYFLVESNISKQLEIIQKKYFKFVEIGSYPFFRLGKIGVSVVSRSTSKSKLSLVKKDLMKIINLKKIKILKNLN